MLELFEVPSHLQILISDFFKNDDFKDRNIGFVFLIYKLGYRNGIQSRSHTYLDLTEKIDEEKKEGE